MSTRVTKAQLQDEVEKLRALVDHLETTNAALKDQVAHLEHAVQGAVAMSSDAGRDDELIDQLRVDVQQLQAENTALHTEVREAELQRIGLAMLIEHWAGLNTATYVNVDHGTFLDMARAGFEAKAQQQVQQRVVRKVFEFNPALPGDFARAMNEARKHNGVVRRVTQ